MISAAARVWRLRLLGVAFLGVLALLLGLAVAVYQKKFVDIVPVTLRTGRVGSQLAAPGDVKLRGLIVGEIRRTTSDGTGARIEIALKPQMVELIPANVEARILPKTLFGEKFVDLIIPATPAADHIAAGDVITEDRSRTAIETERVFENLLPLLQAVEPAKLNSSLSAVATALQGRGDALGDNLVRAGTYFRGLNPSLPTLTEDLARLADVARSYDASAPDLLRFLANSSVTARTLTEKSDALAAFLAGTTGFASTATDLLAEQGDRMIRLADVSRPTLETAARYSPMFPCLLRGLTEMVPLASETFGGTQGPYLHITLEVIDQRGGYQPGVDLPKYEADPGPRCYGLPQPGEVDKGPGAGSGQTIAAGSFLDGVTGSVGTPEEKARVARVAGPVMGVTAADVPDIATLLLGPMMRGTQVGLA
ncbi:MAG TPA: MCE family protein [Mycobacteriales bacterium]|nr:MCE family protein [Mycobacteriales bacterium]